MHPRLSLLVPTRQRPEQLARFLDSLAETTARPDQLEVVLVVDEDNSDSRVTHDRIPIVHAVGPPGRTMGQLNQAGYAAASGDFLMLLNDDVVVRTQNWDDEVRPWLDAFPDRVVLIHVNDTLMREHLCTFPLVSRLYCRIAGGICPAEYRRYRIDDHIQEVFTLLGAMGERRMVHLPDVVFEHTNAVEVADGVREYHADAAVLALDAPLFDALLPRRKELALRLLARIEQHRLEGRLAMRERQLDALADPAALRHPSRLRIASGLYRPSGRVTVGVLASDAHSPACRRCLDALSAHTKDFELALVEQPFPTPGAVNRLLAACRTDLVAVLTQDVVVEPGWLDGLMAYLAPAVGMVVAGEAAFLLDRMRTRHLLFEESYERYFFAHDFALRLREAGFGVARSPLVMSACAEVDADTFARDRRRFEAEWVATGRLRRIEAEGDPHYPPLPPAPPPPAGPRLLNRLMRCYRERGVRGLARAVARRLG